MKSAQPASNEQLTLKALTPDYWHYFMHIICTLVDPRGMKMREKCNTQWKFNGSEIAIMNGKLMVIVPKFPLLMVNGTC